MVWRIQISINRNRVKYIVTYSICGHCGARPRCPSSKDLGPSHSRCCGQSAFSYQPPGGPSQLERMAWWEVTFLQWLVTPTQDNHGILKSQSSFILFAHDTVRQAFGLRLAGHLGSTEHLLGSFTPCIQLVTRRYNKASVINEPDTQMLLWVGSVLSFG